jgi:hypothetical protein
MSHYGVIVLVDPAEMGPGGIDAAVAEALEPHEGARWDWYQIGGRWTGHFTGYQPDKDPANIEPCDLCGGTGDRATFRGESKENQHPSGCNGCLGEGKRARWPTQWQRHSGDIRAVDVLNEGDLDVYALCDGSNWFGGEDYLPWKGQHGEFVKREMPPLEWLQKERADYLAVIVDCHN